MTSDTTEFGASVEECIRLFLANRTSNPTESIMRVRALQELSEGVSTHDLLSLVSAIKQAGEANQLTDALNAYLGTPNKVEAA